MSKPKKLTLDSPITNFDGDPLHINSADGIFDEPKTIIIKESKREIENVVSFSVGKQKLTLRRAIHNALMYQISPRHPKYEKMPDFTDRTLLAFRIAAKDDYTFTSDEITIVKDAARVAMEDQPIGGFQLGSIIQFLDRIEMDRQKKGGDET